MLYLSSHTYSLNMNACISYLKLTGGRNNILLIIKALPTFKSTFKLDLKTFSKSSFFILKRGTVRTIIIFNICLTSLYYWSPSP